MKINDILKIRSFNPINMKVSYIFLDEFVCKLVRKVE